jgi:alpha-D-ribose 1-methylphosphonate 5-triphosphate synthase subunit PhnH
MVETETIDGGFANPVFDAQSVFRAIMDAMARPGTLHHVGYLARPPAPLVPAAGAVALTLCDHDTPLWLDPALQTSHAARSWLGFHTGSPLAGTPADAHFALVSKPLELIALQNFAQGAQEYPDRSTTLILQLDTLVSGTDLLLEGPGIEKIATMSPSPLPRHFVEQWKQNRNRFPRGVDLIFAASDGIACLPRTTRFKALEA